MQSIGDRERDDGQDQPAATDEALRRNVQRVVPEAERLPRGADENPISEQVEDVARKIYSDYPEILKALGL